jgi:drug/metabolite transporter (DMT)-like permease
MYGFSTILYIVALRRIPLSVALPCNALSYILVALIGHYRFQEALGPQRMMALAVIAGGFALLQNDSFAVVEFERQQASAAGTAQCSFRVWSTYRSVTTVIGAAWPGPASACRSA